MKNTIEPLMYWITTTRTTLALTTLQQSFFFTDPVTIQYLASTSSILQHTLHSPVNGIHLMKSTAFFREKEVFGPIFEQL